MHTHPSAEEVYDVVVERDSRISKGTVYRNLGLLSQMGQIKKIPMPGTLADRYDFNLSPHHHAICRKCGKIVDVYAQDMARQVRFDEDFSVEQVDLVFTGLCSDCVETGKTRE